MPARSTARKIPALKTPRKPAPKPAAIKPGGIGKLPEWNLADLYPAIDSPALKRDLDRSEAECIAFEKDFKGRLGEMAASAPVKLAEAVKRYEALDDLLGRVVSYASLTYAGNTTDPVRAKFYGDVQERVTSMSLHLLFFTLELNRVEDKVLDDAMAAEASLGHYRPWLEDVRKEKPYQLEDRVEELFHEKSMTAYSAWNRLYDETIAALRFKIGGKELPIEPALNLLQDADGKKRKEAAEALAKTFKQNLRQFALITNTLVQGQGNLRPLAWFPGRCRRAASVEPGRAGGGRCAGHRGARQPIRNCRIAITSSRRNGSARRRCRTGTATRHCRKSTQRTIPWTDARNTVLTAYGAFSPKMAEVADRFFERKLDRRAGAARQAARRLRASDRAVGASLCVAQLPGQAARRDDAGA